MVSTVDKYLKDIKLDIFKEILTYNLNIKKEQLLIIGDTGLKGNRVSPVLSHAFQRAAVELEIDNDMILQEATIQGDHADPEVLVKLKNLPKNSVIIMNMSQRLGKLGKIGLSFRKFCKEQGHRFTSASSLGLIKNENIKEILDSYDIDYKAISEKANKIKKLWDKASELEITSPNGTNVLVNIKGMKAIVADGIYRKPGQGGNLPGTEVYIAPKDDLVEGQIVIDASMRSRKGTTLVKHPFAMDINKGTVVGMIETPDSEILEETLKWAHNKAKHPWGVRRIAEFGLGLNPKAKVIGCTVIDEKTLGTGHFAIGSNYWFGGKIYAIIHLDQVMYKPKIKVDGKLLEV